MGAHASCFAGLAATGLVVNYVGKKHETLADNYSLGKELSRGTFGVVHMCTRKRSGQKYAVKRVAKRRGSNSIASINLEVDMLLRLAHPNVVELHEVYPGTDAVDMVFTVYHGGDVTTAAQRHFACDGDLPMAAVQNLTRQMFRAVEWLHSNSVVHRDVKGDNCLLDRRELAHPDCRLCLADFGAAAVLRPGVRLQALRGTRQYWAPEFHARSYGLKVDVWAAGVVAYALMAQQFPFGSSDKARARQVEIPARCGEAAGSFLLGALARGEEERLSASAALEHPFLAEDEETDDNESVAHRDTDTSSEAPLRAKRPKLPAADAASSARRRLASGPSDDAAATTTACSSRSSDGRRLTTSCAGSALGEEVLSATYSFDNDDASPVAFVPSFAVL